MNTEHTPGPWGIEISTSSSVIFICTDEREIAVISEVGSDEDETNARLIAAAPDLLEALIAVVAVADRRTVEFDKARAAIARATGKEAS